VYPVNLAVFPRPALQGPEWIKAVIFHHKVAVRSPDAVEMLAGEFRLGYDAPPV
jgi:hypothetical protein